MNSFAKNILTGIPMCIGLLIFINYFIDMSWWGNAFIILAAGFVIGQNVYALWHSRKHNYDISKGGYTSDYLKNHYWKK
ncbi:hypothetical protein [Salinicoccus sp. HZC-1]|uniref:hypothetical protein n=1 Tax=Salinicoccus sp. HZC-1 TaxID=3385497 RepID=UPI00398ACF59